MKNNFGNALCFLISAAGFAFIGYEAAAHHGSTHSGTQPYVQVTPERNK